YRDHTGTEVGNKIENWRKRYRNVRKQCTQDKVHMTQTGRETTIADVDTDLGHEKWQLFQTYHEAFGDDPSLNPERADELGDPAKVEELDGEGPVASEGDGGEEGGPEPELDDGDEDEEGSEETFPWDAEAQLNLASNKDNAKETSELSLGGSEEQLPERGKSQAEADSAAATAATASVGVPSKNARKKAKPGLKQKKSPASLPSAAAATNGKKLAGGRLSEEDGKPGPRLTTKEQRATASVVDQLEFARKDEAARRDREAEREHKDRKERRAHEERMLQMQMNQQHQLAMFSAQMQQQTMLLLAGNFNPSSSPASTTVPTFPNQFPNQAGYGVPPAAQGPSYVAQMNGSPQAPPFFQPVFAAAAPNPFAPNFAASIAGTQTGINPASPANTQSPELARGFRPFQSGAAPNVMGSP
ncbi:hypothetical protein KFL_014510010, partial [Klebsormidium nitens]